MYLRDKNEVSRSRFSKVTARTGQTDTRTDRQTDRKDHHAGGNNVALRNFEIAHAQFANC